MKQKISLTSTWKKNVLYISFYSDGSPTYFGVISHFASNVTEIQNSSCCGLSSEANEYFVSHARWFSMAIFMFTGRSMTEVFLRSWVTVLVTATLMARIPDQHIQCLLILSLILTLNLALYSIKLTNHITLPLQLVSLRDSYLDALISLANHINSSTSALLWVHTNR